MSAFRVGGAARRLLAVLVTVLAVALCLGVLGSPSWAEESATSQVEMDASSQVKGSVGTAGPDSASGSDADISRTDVAAGAADSAAPESDAAGSTAPEPGTADSVSSESGTAGSAALEADADEAASDITSAANPGFIPGSDAASQQALIGEAASHEDASASSQTFPSGSSVTSDPSQVPEYDAAADTEPEGSSAPMGYGSAGDSAANAPVAYSATVYSGDWSYYESKDDSGNTVYVLDGYYGLASSITLPAKLDGKQIYSVNFYGGGLPKTVTSVTFPATIKEIGASCFSYTKVSKITFPSNSQLVRIGECAFEKTPITSFVIPQNVKTLGHDAFRNSLLTKLTLNANLEPMVYVGNVISGSNTYQVTEHYNPCGGCPAVTFVVPSNAKNYKVVNGALLSRDGTILYAQTSNLGGGTYTVPAGVTTIGSYAMCNNATFSNIVLPQGLTRMEQYCLYGTAIQSLDMPDSVTCVQGYICSNCDQLRSVRISNNVTELGECAGWECFFNCSNLTSVTLGSSLRTIGNACFAGSAITSIDLPSSLVQINYGAFGDCKQLARVTGGQNLKYIYRYAFRYAPITGFPFGSDLRFVSNEAFFGCGFTPSYPSYLDEQPDGYYKYDGTLSVEAQVSYSKAFEVLGLVNQERAKQGLSALTMDADLLAVAMQRAAETSIVFDHTRPTGQKCFTASSKMTRENIAVGSTTAQGVMDQWMNSSGHKANILSSDSTSIGIGCVTVSGRTFWVQCFGTAAASPAYKQADKRLVMDVNYMSSALAELGTTFSVYPVDAAGTSIVAANESLGVGESQRFSLFAHIGGTYASWVSKIDDSCVTWSLDGFSAASFNPKTVTVSGKAPGSFTLSASVGGGSILESVTTPVAYRYYAVTFGTYNRWNYDVDVISTQKVRSGDTLKKPADPTRDGYVFDGWYTTGSCTTPFDFKVPITSNKTVYAKWRYPATYTVTFNANGGTCSQTTASVEEGKAVSKPANPTRAGHTFKGWYSDKGLTKAYDFNASVKGNITLYAKWAPNGYTVTFNSNGGTSVKAQSVTYGAKASRPADPAKSGFYFKGWYADKGLTRAFDFSSAVKGNLTLYAKWEQVPPTSFKDVPAGEWYTDWVTQAAKRGLMTGLKDDAGVYYTGYFEPDSAVTRAMVATVLWRVAGSPACSSGALWDVQGHWAYEAVAWCMSKGIVTGYTSGPNAGCFLPDNEVTREELATMAYRFAKWAGVKTANPPSASFNAASDTWAVSPWARDAMVWCGASGVLTGFTGEDRPLLLPQGTATRAQAAKIFTQMDKLAGGELSPYAEAEDRPVADAAQQQPAEAPTAVAGELDGLTYLTVPEGAVDAAGEAYVLDREYAELGGRYVGAGVYVTAYRGEATDLALPAQIGGVDVVSADLSWGGDAQAGVPDPEGRTRLESLSLERGCGLASLDASGSDVAGIELAGDEALGGLPALRFLDLSGTRVSSLDPTPMPALERLALRGCPLGADSLEALTAWSGATGLPADLEGAGAEAEPSEPEQPGEPASPDQPAGPEQPSNPAEPAVPGEPEQPAEPAIPDQPSEPSEPAAPDEPEQPSKSAAPSEPVQPAVPSESAGSELAFISGADSGRDSAGSESLSLT